MEPLTEVRPKPMLELANRPILEYVVDAVARAGIDDIVIVVGYKRERIQSYFEDGNEWDIDIQYVVQEKQLGTGHAILQAESVIDEAFLVLNGDRVVEAQIVETLRHDSADDVALMAVTSSDQPSEFGVVDIDGDAVRSVTEKPSVHATTSNIINAGIYRFGMDVFDVLRETEATGELRVTDALQQLAEAGEVRAVTYDGPWLDVSYLWDLVVGNSIVLDRYGSDPPEDADVHELSLIGRDVAVGEGARIGPHTTVMAGTALGDNVSVGSNVVLSNVIVMADATIHDGAVVGDTVVGEGAIIGPHTTIPGGAATVLADGRVHEDVRLGGVIGDRTRIGANVTFDPGTIVGTGAQIEGGCRIDGRVPSNAEVRRG